MVEIREKLREKPIIGTIVLIIIYLIFLFASVMLATILVPITDNASFIAYILAEFIFVFILLSLLWLWIVPSVLYLPNGKESFRKYSETIRLSTVQPLWQNILIGVSCAAVTCLCVFIASLILGGHVFDLNILFGNPDVEQARFGWGIFIYMLKAGIWEEIAFRGVILTLLLRKYSRWKALIIDGIAFGLLHLANLLMSIGSEDFAIYLVLTLSQVIYAALLGIVQGYQFVKTESLLPCMLTHYLINVFVQLLIVTEVTNFMIYSVYLIISIGVIPAIINILLVKFIVEREKKS